jgi:hypothetical protein
MTQPAGVIFGIVKDRNGNPVARARVSFSAGPVSLPDIAALTDAKGAFTLAAPAAGNYTIDVVTEEFALKKTDMTVAVGQKEHIEVILGKETE